MAATPTHVAALTAIFYSLCLPTRLSVTGLDGIEVKQKDYDAEVVLMINPQGSPLPWFWFGRLITEHVH
jgi:hypothetical protein